MTKVRPSIRARVNRSATRSAVGAARGPSTPSSQLSTNLAFAKLIAFDRPLAGAALPGGGRAYTEVEISARAEEAYRKGVDSARATMDQKMVEMRVDMEQLS